ncbi:hypothetical protein B566_EDAN013494 [Ephemera danica]|nr:hypothetical protein B566_EDAN013494 [Ephemera danica]
MAENTDQANNDIPQIKLARVQKVPPFLLVKHIPKPSETEVKGEEKKKVFNCKCSVCEKSYTTVFNLHRHLRRVHKLLVLKLRKGEFICDVCQRCYTSKKNLASHFSMKHKTSEQKQKAAITCPECHLVFRQRELLRNHIADTHGVVFESKEFTFSCRDEFEKWKAELEKEDNTKYVRFCGKKKYSPTKWREYHLCHRTGFFKRKKNVTRRLKQNGSCKIGGTCPATIIVNGTSESEELQVVLWGQHFGHGPDAPLVKDGQYKRIRKRTHKTISNTELSAEEFHVKPGRKYRRKRKKRDSNDQDLDNNIQLASSDVPVIISNTADNLADNNGAYTCIISSSDVRVTEIMGVETVSRLDVSKIARKHNSPKTRRKYTASRRRTRNIANESPASPIMTYSDSEDGPAETSRSILLDLPSPSPITIYSDSEDGPSEANRSIDPPPASPVTTHSDSDDETSEANRSMLLDPPPASPITIYSDSDDSEANRSLLLEQINQLRHIVLNKNISDREQSFTLKKLNACLQMFKDN